MECAVHYIRQYLQNQPIVHNHWSWYGVEITYLDIIPKKKIVILYSRSQLWYPYECKMQTKKRSKMYFWGEPKCKNYVLLCPYLPRALIWRTRSILVAIFGRIIGGAFTSGVFLQIFNLLFSFQSFILWKRTLYCLWVKLADCSTREN